MLKTKITSTKCLNDKKHKWEHIAIENIGSYGSHIHKWCPICGSRTEYYRDVGMIRSQRCRSNDNKDYFIEIPKCLKE